MKKKWILCAALVLLFSLLLTANAGGWTVNTGVFCMEWQGKLYDYTIACPAEAYAVNLTYICSDEEAMTLANYSGNLRLIFRVGEADEDGQWYDAAGFSEIYENLWLGFTGQPYVASRAAHKCTNWEVVDKEGQLCCYGCKEKHNCADWGTFTEEGKNYCKGCGEEVVCTHANCETAVQLPNGLGARGYEMNVCRDCGRIAILRYGTDVPADAYFTMGEEDSYKALLFTIGNVPAVYLESGEVTVSAEQAQAMVDAGITALEIHVGEVVYTVDAASLEGASLTVTVGETVSFVLTDAEGAQTDVTADYVK